MISPYKINGFPKGFCNLGNAFALPEGTCRDAVNVDFDNAGKFRRRPGFAVLVGGAADSLFVFGNLALFRQGSAIKRLWPDGSTTTLATLATPAPVRFLKHADAVFWVTGAENGVIRNQANGPWGVERADNTARLTALDYGALFAGDYQVAFTFVSTTGEEGGTGKAQTVTVPANGGGIALANIPQPSQAMAINLYVSAHNGQELYLQGQIPAGVAQAQVGGILTGAALQTQFCRPPPAGSALVGLGSRIYIAKGNTVWRTRPSRYGLFRPRSDFKTFSDDDRQRTEIRVLAAVQDGVYVVTESTTWWWGNPDTEQPVQLLDLPYGAPKHAAIQLPKTQQVCWFSNRGWVIAGPSGQIQNVTEDVFAPFVHQEGAIFLREQNGLRHLIAAFPDGKPSPRMAEDWIAAL